MPMLLKCGHPACHNCIVEVRSSQEEGKWITFCCQECNEDDEVEYDYHLKYHKQCKQALKNKNSEPKPKIEGASFICARHENQRIVTYCEKCDSYLCFECLMDHLDHAKGNFSNATEEVLF
jgi:hypothetical protein